MSFHRAVVIIFFVLVLCLSGPGCTGKGGDGGSARDTVSENTGGQGTSGVSDTDEGGSAGSGAEETGSSSDTESGSTSGSGSSGTGGSTGSESGCDDSLVNNDIPFDYTVDTDHIDIHTTGGDLETHIGPWGAHNLPHTGHTEGDAKANWAGLYASRYTDLTELEGDGDGICQKGELCGIEAASIDQRIPEYIAPDDGFMVRSVRAEGIVTAGDTYMSVLQWRIEIRNCNYTYFIGHVGTVASDLRDKMITAGYTDPSTVTGISDNLITGDPIVLDKGDSIGIPQIVAQEVPGHDGYFYGGGSYSQTPWAQIEFITVYNGISGPFYSWLPESVQADLLDILYEDASNPDSFRYEYISVPDWVWKAEVYLWTADLTDGDDYSSIFAHLGGWWENNPDGCESGTPLCDELVSIYPIIKASSFYDSSLYDSSDVSYLIHRERPLEDPAVYRWGEVVDPVSPDEVSGSLIVKWRYEDTKEIIEYQALGYSLNEEEQILKIRWGDAESDRTAVVIPAIPTDEDTCDGETLTCHNSDSSWRWGG